MTTPQPKPSPYPAGSYVPGPPAYRSRAAYVVSRGVQQVNVPKPLPRIAGNSVLIIVAWGIAMALVFADEWKQHHILARPSRLWHTTAVYGILAVAGMVPALLPIMNAMAIGFALVLAYQFFSHGGQFAHSGGGNIGTGGGTGGSGKK